MIFKCKNYFFKDRERCLPYITQDGYDSGLILCCNLHYDEMDYGEAKRGEPVMMMWPDGDVRQTYEVTYAMMKQLVKDHYKRFKE